MASFTVATSSSSYYSDDAPRPLRCPLHIIPASAFDGYVSPSGGLISYGCFDIRGKNLSTKRKPRRYFEAQTEELACKLAEDSGMAGPFEVSVRPSKPAESWQLSELKIYNIVDPVPDGLSYWDVRALHERIARCDRASVPFDFARLAFLFGVKFSRCFGPLTILSAARGLPADKYRELFTALNG